MKTWEMIKQLTENPDKEFKRIGVENGNKSEVGIRNFELTWLYSGDSFLIKLTTLVEEWEEVKQPVTWQEAFKAGLEGKKIKMDGQNLTYSDYHSLNYALMYLGERPGYYKELIRGKWYIED